MAKINHEDILAYLEEASILELNDLVKAIEEKFGVTAAAPVAVAAAPAEAADQGPTSVARLSTNALWFLANFDKILAGAVASFEKAIALGPFKDSFNSAKPNSSTALCAIVFL